MAGGGPSVGSYSPLTGFVFIFNLIVGAGALTIPHAFAQVGLIYGALALAVLATISYVTATFMIEAIAGVNAIKKRAHQLGVDPAEEPDKYSDDNSSTIDEIDSGRTEILPLIEQDRLDKSGHIKSPDIGRLDFDLSKKMELAQMAHLLFNRKGNIAFYACTIVYLYGDLAIYAVAVPKSLREILCPRPSSEVTQWQCSDRFSSSDLYRLFVLLFGLLLGPFAFGHVQKTRLIQLVTTVIRHASFGLMIVLAVIGIANGKGRSMADVLEYEKPANIATFFGVCIYSFMCHHSIPGLVAPISDKSKVGSVLAFSFAAVLLVYFVLCTSATFRFLPDDIDDVYTLNFKDYPVQFFAYFLSLFPVFTLSANFPVICITLRENVRHLAHSVRGVHSVEDASHAPATLGEFLERHIYALAALVPPLVVAFFTEDVSMLVGFTGAYAGLGIQWVVPSCLVLSLRRRLRREGLGGGSNKFASPFRSDAWLALTLGCSLVSIVLITATHTLK